MAISVFPAPAAGKVRQLITLLSGTSWTVPATVTFINVTLVGAGNGTYSTVGGNHGQTMKSLVATTPGASITYAIGAGGNVGNAGAAGSTTMTGATTAAGGNTGNGGAVLQGILADNGALMNSGVIGGAGSIEIEYWI